MDDMTGKKFSLQDWVTRRAANQSGGAASRVGGAQMIEPLSIKKAVNGDDALQASSESFTSSDERQEDRIAFDTPASITVSAPESELKDSVSSNSNPKDVLAKDILGKIDAKIEGRPNPVQQLQIVRLLSDLGERLRQSEKEREILWKEIEVCRKQIGDLETKNSKSEKTYQTFESQLGEKETFIKGLLDKQTELETLLKTQSDVAEKSKSAAVELEERLEQKISEKQAELEAILKAQADSVEQSKSETAKFEERLEQKLSGIETTTGSAIVRIEDALEENNKLSKRIEELSQDKARLSRKLEVMEETLTQTQETLKAKALVLLTDQALAAKTSLPQTPAWSGDDTLRISPRPADKDPSSGNGLLSDIKASIKKNKKGSPSDMNNTAFLAALVVLGIAGGVLFSQINFKSVPSLTWSQGNESSSSSNPVEEQSSNEVAPNDEQLEPQDQPQSQEVLMSDIARMANQLEPATQSEEDASVTDPDVIQDSGAGSEFDKAIDSEDKALEQFQKDRPKTDLKARIKADKSLPQPVRAIETKAFSGDAAAQHDLAAIYTAGSMGVKVNYDRAVKWFTEAAYQNVANAQYNLGVLYHQGLGVQKNIAKAIDMYRVAAANGHPEAQYNLAIAYIEGVGAEYNPQIASVYFQKAASGGVVEAAYNLGLLHENGLLGESQPDEAVFWYTLAAGKGDKQAKAALDQLKSQLSMSDEDAARIVERIAKTKPGFLDKSGKAALPDPVKLSMSSVGSSVASSAEESLRNTEADRATVSQIQEHLIRLGLYKGMATGEMSSAVTDAIKSYQKDHGLKVDGFPSDTLLVHILANETAPAAGE